MLTRKSTLTQNISIYSSLLVLLLMHAGFWGKWAIDARTQLKKLTGDVSRLSAEVANLRESTNSTRATMEQTNQELDRRQHELEGLGPFLPSISKKPEVIRTIQNQIERLGIRITNTEFPPPEMSREGGGGYYTVNFTLDLVGPYPAFKQLLAAIPTTAMIIRISTFKLLSTGTDNPAYDWKVQIQFQTYFAG